MSSSVDNVSVSSTPIEASSTPSGAVKVGRFSIVFDQGDAAKNLLLHSDDYLHRMSNAERAIRMESGRTDISEEEFRAHVAVQVLNWGESDISDLTSCFKRIDELMKDLFVKFPDPIHIVQTTGQEEIREAAAYCRGNTIVLSRNTVGYGPFRTLIHELFHIQSQFDPETRKELYALVGFTECNEVSLPPELAAERLTNPDAPKLNARIHVTVKGEEFDVIPVLLYNANRGCGFFQRLYIKMLAVENKGSAENEMWEYIQQDEKALIFDPKECEGFDAQVGKNTRYNFHPDEILADNFRFMVLDSFVSEPRIPDGIKSIFTKV